MIVGIFKDLAPLWFGKSRSYEVLEKTGEKYKKYFGTMQNVADTVLLKMTHDDEVAVEAIKTLCGLVMQLSKMITEIATDSSDDTDGLFEPEEASLYKVSPERIKDIRLERYQDNIMKITEDFKTLLINKKHDMELKSVLYYSLHENSDVFKIKNTECQLVPPDSYQSIKSNLVILVKTPASEEFPKGIPVGEISLSDRVILKQLIHSRYKMPVSVECCTVTDLTRNISRLIDTTNEIIQHYKEVSDQNFSNLTLGLFYKISSLLNPSDMTLKLGEDFMKCSLRDLPMFELENDVSEDTIAMLFDQSSKFIEVNNVEIPWDIKKRIRIPNLKDYSCVPRRI